MRKLILLLTFAVALRAETTDDATWAKFLAWLPGAPPIENPKRLFDAYRLNLTKHGVPESEAEQNVNTITRLMKTRQDGWQAIFNNIYASAQPGFSIRPNGTLVSAVTGRKPGSALDAGMGQGRNSVYLALNGWNVTGFDVSDKGLEIARANAERAGVKVNALQRSEKSFDYGKAKWDLITFTYVPFALTDPQYVARLDASLKPGGLIVIESFASNTGSPNRRPVDIDPVELRKAFSNFQVVKFEDKVGAPEWTTAETRLVKFIAEKKR